MPLQPLPAARSPSLPPPPLADTPGPPALPPPPDLPSSSISPPPAPPAAQSTQPRADFLQFNCNGIRGSRFEILDLLSATQVRVAAIQETKLTPSSAPLHTPGFNLIRRDRPSPNGGGGLAFLVRHDTPFRPIPTDPFFPTDSTLEHQGILVTLPSHSIAIFNIYIPPCTSCPPGYTPDLLPLFEADHGADVLVVGDFNAHHQAWASPSRDDRALARGDIVADAVDSSCLAVLNLDQPTRLPTNGVPSSPDISLASAHLALSATWQPLIRLSSDHLPILIDPYGDHVPQQPGPQRLYSNFRKADWPAFTEHVERALSILPPPASASAGERVFREALRVASGKCVPRGFRREVIPGLTEEAKVLIRERDAARAASHDDPNIAALNDRIKASVAASSRRAWTEKVMAAGPSESTTKFWSLLRSLSGKRTPNPPNQPVSFGRATLSSPSLIAREFCRFFTASRPTRSRNSRSFFRKLRAQRKLDRTFTPFTPQSVAAAVRAAGQSTALGPDGLNIHHLRHLGPVGIEYLTALYNLSASCADLPAIWRKAIIIPIPKAGKPASLSTSYRPISLLSPAIKVLERLLLPLITPHLPLAAHQHGFRPARSTTSALLPLTHSIAAGFNERKPPQRTVALAVDFSKAFDTVPHLTLLQQLAATSLPANLMRWLASYLRGRSACCQYQSVRSGTRGLRAGVPQGSVLSPCLFNFFVADHPTTAADLTTSYADDFTASTSSHCVADAADRLAGHANDVEVWARNKGLSISLPKSHTTLFTSDTHQSFLHPDVELAGARVPLCRQPKILGVTLDTHFTFSPHVRTTAERARSRLSILKALAGVNWGQSKEVLLLTYRALIKPVLSYAAPIWYPNASDSAISTLQSIQNSALRIATGSLRMASVPHLHQEAKALEVGPHLSLLCSQFLLRTLLPDHPSHTVTSAHSGPRCIRHTLQSRFMPTIRHLLTDGMASADTYRANMRSLHSAAVAGAIASLGDNRLLGCHPPEIHPSELNLPRPHRTTLSQLRSGFCSTLREYRHRIGLADSATCPECADPCQSVPHLFDCSSYPTPLAVLDLWERPTEVAAFLSSLPSFSFLPPLDPPPPEPPPLP